MPRRPRLLAGGFIRPHLPLIAPEPFWVAAERSPPPLPARTVPPANASLLTGRSLQEGLTEIYGNYGQRLAERRRPRLSAGGGLGRKLAVGYSAAVSFVDSQVGHY